ncbi:MAG: porin [Bacteroidota bacterium]
MLRFFLLIFLLLSSISFLFCQEQSHWLPINKDFKIQAFLSAQLWSSYTFDQLVFEEESQTYNAVDNRFNFLIRRARIGFRAEAYDHLKFYVAGAYDLIGRDVLSGLRGGTNNGSLPNVGIWDAFIQWKINPSSDAFHLTAGYFRPQLSRESITSGWSVNSMEKSFSQNYIRRHLTGIGPGRAAGINLGGLLLNDNQDFGINYNIGIFTPSYLSNSGNSGGTVSSPLFVARSVFFLGEPEMQDYKLGYNINYFNQRKGLSIGMSGSWQGETELFSSSYTAQLDFLLNLGPLNLDGDWNFMWRRSLPNEIITLSEKLSASNTGHLRIGYNIILQQKIFLEPTFMLMQFNGAINDLPRALAQNVGHFSGKDYTYDIGINWYLNKNRLKLMLHYIIHDGNLGSAPDGSAINQFFSQGNVGAIQRGDWLGLGMNFIL